MNEIRPALAAQLEKIWPTATPLEAFTSRVKDGYITPAEMADAIYAMHAALVDRYPQVELWMAVSLEQTADALTKAIECAERQDEDFPIAEAA